MKKYIRTKDSVYELKVNEELKARKTSNYFYINDKRFACNLLFDKQYAKKCKQADTIEKLCDCYSYDTETTKDYSVARSWKLHNKEREIFGCIKTNRGLIYVAKMNEKGELELL